MQLRELRPCSLYLMHSSLLRLVVKDTYFASFLSASDQKLISLCGVIRGVSHLLRDARNVEMTEIGSEETQRSPRRITHYAALQLYSGSRRPWRMSLIVSSPEEEEEEVEEALPARRVPIPSSVTKDLLRASASGSRSSRGGTSMTPTPRHAIATEGHRSTPLKVLSSSVEKQRPVPSSFRNDSRPSSDPKRIIVMDTSDDEEATGVKSDESDTDDSDRSSILETAPRAGPSRHMHGPRSLSTDPLVLAARARSSTSLSPPPALPESSATSSYRSSPIPFVKYNGAPYVEIPYIPLARLKRYSKPNNVRHPTTLSRNHQIHFTQTPPLSPCDSISEHSFELIEVVRPERPKRTGIVRTLPTWRTRSITASSPDLGGYGSDPLSEEEKDSEASEDSVVGHRRTTRRTDKQQTGRTTKAHNQVSVCLCALQDGGDMRAIWKTEPPLFSISCLGC